MNWLANGLADKLPNWLIAWLTKFKKLSQTISNNQVFNNFDVRIALLPSRCAIFLLTVQCSWSTRWLPAIMSCDSDITGQHFQQLSSRMLEFEISFDNSISQLIWNCINSLMECKVKPNDQFFFASPFASTPTKTAPTCEAEGSCWESHRGHPKSNWRTSSGHGLAAPSFNLQIFKWTTNLKLVAIDEKTQIMPWVLRFWGRHLGVWSACVANEFCRF